MSQGLRDVQSLSPRFSHADPLLDYCCRYEVREIDVEGPAFTAKLQAPFDGVDSPQLQWWFAIRGSNTQLISSRVPIVTSMCHEGQN